MSVSQGAVSTTICRSSSKAVCDICWFGSQGGVGRQLSNLVTCKTCQVTVHPECYELGATVGTKKKRDNFQCWACQAVGTTVKFRQRDPIGDRLVKKILRRPTDCCLCGTPDSDITPHAMHPLYDDYGPRARQIKLDKNNDPAWVHTLCALVVANFSKGLVYACSRDGSYAGQEEEDTERLVEDTDSINSALMEDDDDEGEEEEADDKEEDEEATHHFTYVMERWYGPNQGHVKVGKDHAPLKCRGCNKNGIGENVYRFAIQCQANMPEEFEDFRAKHRYMAADTCYEAWHVGCARYSKNDDGEYPGCRTVYYYPGGSDGAEWIEPVCNLFCPMHAADLYNPNKLQGMVHYPPGSKVTVPKQSAAGKKRSSFLRRAMQDEASGSATSTRRASIRQQASNNKKTPPIDRSSPRDGDEGGFKADLDEGGNSRGAASTNRKRSSASHVKDSGAKLVAKGEATTKSEAIDEHDRKRPAKRQRRNETDNAPTNGLTNGNTGTNSSETLQQPQNVRPAAVISDDSMLQTQNQARPLHRQVAVKQEVDDDEKVPLHLCYGITLSSLLSDKRSDDEAETIEQGFGRMVGNAVKNLSVAITNAVPWPISTSDWHGALFKKEENDPWCKIKAQPGVSPNTDIRHRFALHAFVCNTSTNSIDGQCPACKQMKKQALKKVRQLGKQA